MATIRLLCLLLGFGSLVGGAGFPSHLLAENTRTRIIEIASSQLGVREKTGNNDGKMVEAYLRYTYLDRGNPWCAAFISWVYGQAGLSKPRSAWSPDLVPKFRKTLRPNVGDVFGIYFADKKRVAHVGLVSKKKHDWVYTIEGNTNEAGGREGDGVYRKLRHAKQIYVYADWVNKNGGIR